MNVQVRCDNKLLIPDIVASHKGSTHDSRIFNESTLKTKLEGLPGYLHCLGDRGYACQRFLLSPLANPRTVPERCYNFVHSSTRMVTERTFGIWKRFLPCLSKGLNFNPEECVVLIVAAAVLYNFARPCNELEDEDIEFDDDDNYGQDNGNAQGQAKRIVIICDYFT
uniref:DDE Tnp4 domain-containing protein n=1 Tax=Romanomermis culicivorax TaxID=13658 RepID=A0A915IHX3_ROMCU